MLPGIEPRHSGERHIYTPEVCALLDRARRLSIVESRLITVEQAAYCLGWGEILNPNHGPFRMLYSRMGSDAVTPLLMGADEIVGIDTGFAPAERLDPAKHLDAFHRSLDHRRRVGYYSAGIMDQFGAERVLMYDLQCLGVDMSRVQFVHDLKNRVTEIRFMLERPRRIVLHAMSIEEYLRTHTQESFDAVYEKAAMDHPLVYSRELPSACALVKPGGCFVSSVMRGAGVETKSLPQRSKEFDRNMQQQQFDPITASQPLKALIEHLKKNSEKPNLVEYGMHLQGARKR